MALTSRSLAHGISDSVLREPLMACLLVGGRSSCTADLFRSSILRGRWEDVKGEASGMSE